MSRFPLLPEKQSYGPIGVLMGGPSAEREISLKSGEAVTKALLKKGYCVTPVVLTAKDAMGLPLPDPASLASRRSQGPADGRQAGVVSEAVLARGVGPKDHVPRARGALKARPLSSSHREEVKTCLKSLHLDVAFIALHGTFGEDGCVQSILEELGISYTGSGIAASQRAFHKITAQEIFCRHQIPVPAFMRGRLSDRFDLKELSRVVGDFPWVIKPASEGSSIGITIVSEEAGFLPALNKAFAYGQEILIERYISGREVTVGILGERALPVVEIRSKNAFFDYQAKYEKGRTEYLVPAPLAAGLSRKLQDIALRAHRLLGCRDLSRVDILLDDRLSPYVIDVNTIPGFTSMSLLPMAAARAGLTFEDLCGKLVEMAWERGGTQQATSSVFPKF